MAMMDCKQVLANLSDYVDGEVSDEVRKALEEHVARCRRCRVVLDTTRSSLTLVLDVEPFEVPLAVSARLYTRLEEVLAEDRGVPLNDCRLCCKTNNPKEKKHNEITNVEPRSSIAVCRGERRRDPKTVPIPAKSWTAVCQDGLSRNDAQGTRMAGKENDPQPRKCAHWTA